MAENQTAGTNGAVQPVQTGGIITDPKILQGLTKAYNVNCKKLQYLLGRYYLQKFLTGGEEYKTELKKISEELKTASDKKEKKKKKDGKDMPSKEEKESLFIADQLSVFQIYQSIYKKHLELKADAERKAAEKKADDERKAVEKKL